MAGSYIVIDDKLQGLKCLPALVQQLSDQIDVLIQKRESARQRNKDDTEHRRPRTWAGEYKPPTRFIRMEFPRFQRSDVIRWIQECERYFELEGTPDNERVWLARKNLDEKGYIWHLAFEEEEGGRRISWQRYKQALQVRFGPLNSINTARTSTGNHGGSIPRPLNGTRGVIYASRNSETEKNLRPASGVVGSFSCEPESWTKAKSSSGENGSSQEECVGVQESLGVDENSKNSSACFLGDKQTTTSAQNESSAMMDDNPTADMNAFDFVILGSRQQKSSTMEQEGEATLLRGSLSSSSGFVLVDTNVSSSSNRRELKRPVHWYDGLLRKWLSLVQLYPTQSFQHSWFSGALITMLCGRLCSLRIKKKAALESHTQKLLETNLNFTWLRNFKLEKSNFQLSSIFSRVRSILKGTAGLQF